MKTYMYVPSIRGLHAHVHKRPPLSWHVLQAHIRRSQNPLPLCWYSNCARSLSLSVLLFSVKKTWTMLITLILHKLSRTFLLNDIGKYSPGVHGCGENPGGCSKSQTVNYILCSCTLCLPTQYLLHDCLWYSWIQILSYNLAIWEYYSMAVQL